MQTRDDVTAANNLSAELDRKVFETLSNLLRRFEQDNITQLELKGGVSALQEATMGLLNDESLYEIMDSFATDFEVTTGDIILFERGRFLKIFYRTTTGMDDSVVNYAVMTDVKWNVSDAKEKGISTQEWMRRASIKLLHNGNKLL
jgi:hypothetical protein